MLLMQYALDRALQYVSGRAQYAHIEDSQTDQTILSHPKSFVA